MAKPKVLKSYVVDVYELQIVHVNATSKADAVKRVDAGEGEVVQGNVDQWAAGVKYCRLNDQQED